MRRLAKKGSVLVMDDFQIGHVKMSVNRAVKENLVKIRSQNQTDYVVSNAFKWERSGTAGNYGAGSTKVWGVLEFI